MTEENQEKALGLVDNLRTRNGTKICEAIKEAIDYMEKRDQKDHNPQIMFFTDGMDYYTTTEKCLADLKALKELNNFTCPINTYGFGMYNDVNTDQLVQISKEFNGMNGYIPDCTNIGTTFVNSIANMLTGAASNVKIELDKRIVEIGTVRYGQPIEILV